MTLTQILQKIRNVFYTKKEIDSMGGGSSLSDTISQKANDSDVVHKSGDETIDGVKTFSDIAIVGKDNFNIQSGGSWDGGARLTLNKKTESMSAVLQTFSNTDTSGYIYDINSFYPYENNKNNLGASTNKWKTINGVNPGVLSFPSTSGINYSSYISSGAGDIRIKAPADGWFKLNAYCQSGTKFRCAIDSINLGVEVMTGASGYHTAMCPIKKDEYVALCVTGTNIICQFFPCEGNV